VFLYANPQGADGVVKAARAAGVERIVLLSSGSVLHPTSAGNPITEEHRAVEQAFLLAPDLTVLPIRPLVLATNVLAWAYSIRADRSVALYRPEAITAPIHERDLAEVAAAALTSADERVTGMLTGPAWITQREQVAAIGQALGVELEVTELSRAQAGERFARFMPAEEAEAVLRFVDDAAAGNSPATSTVLDVLGRPALDFAVWAGDHVNDFR
jgi:uncharacterized protein YbjT (DUF2867 family)